MNVKMETGEINVIDVEKKDTIKETVKCPDPLQEEDIEVDIPDPEGINKIKKKKVILNKLYVYYNLN